VTVALDPTPKATPPVVDASTNRLVDLVFRVREFGIIAVLLLLVVVTAAIQPRFLSMQELQFILLDTTVFALLAIGETMVVLTRNVDLSVGAVLGLTSYVATVLMRDYAVPPIFAALAAVAVGAAIGSVNGFLVVRFRVHSFVVTLGTMLIWRGVVITLTGGFPITVTIPAEFRAVMSGPLPDSWWLLTGFRASMLWFFLIGGLGTFLLVRTRFGNWIQARGQNEQAARNLGVPVDRLTISLFMLTSALAAVTGVIQVARFASVDALRGQDFELQAVAVTVIGGTLLSGGYGSVIGTILGAITYGMIQVGLVLAGVPGHYFRTLTGFIVVAAVILNTDVARRMARSRPLRGFQRSSAASDAAILAQRGEGEAGNGADRAPIPGAAPEPRP